MRIISVLKQIKNGQLPSFTYMFKRIWEYAREYSKEYGISRIYIFADYFKCALVDGCTGINYFLYRFFRLKRKARLSFVTEGYADKFENAHTDSEQSRIIDDKEKSLDYFKDYMMRDWCALSYKNTQTDYENFYFKHEKGIIKPIDGHGGHGIRIVDLKNEFRSGEALREYCLKNGLLVEELILQHEDLNKVYPNAINTIRMVTLKGKLIGASIRMGVCEANVDNAHSGGIFAEVDINEGIVVGKAMRYTNERFVRHPSTGTIIPGVRIPYWNECVSIVEEASKLVPDVYLVGWDVAVTPNGPTFVEVNTGPGLELVQAPNGHGLKAEFEKIKD